MFYFTYLRMVQSHFSNSFFILIIIILKISYLIDHHDYYFQNK